MALLRKGFVGPLLLLIICASLRIDRTRGSSIVKRSVEDAGDGLASDPVLAQQDGEEGPRESVVSDAEVDVDDELSLDRDDDDNDGDDDGDEDGDDDLRLPDDQDDIEDYDSDSEREINQEEYDPTLDSERDDDVIDVDDEGEVDDLVPIDPDTSVEDLKTIMISMMDEVLQAEDYKERIGQSHEGVVHDGSNDTSTDDSSAQVKDSDVDMEEVIAAMDDLHTIMLGFVPEEVHDPPPQNRMKRSVDYHGSHHSYPSYGDGHEGHYGHYDDHYWHSVGKKKSDYLDELVHRLKYYDYPLYYGYLHDHGGYYGKKHHGYHGKGHYRHHGYHGKRHHRHHGGHGRRWRHGGRGHHGGHHH